MAIYHASLKVFARSAGQSATAAAAYRAGLCLNDTRTGVSHDYRRRSGVVSVTLLAPDGSPSWANDAEKLWNAAEAAERRSNACVARELEVSLPEELTAPQRAELAHDLAQLLVDRYGVAVLAAIHEPGSRNDVRNHHVHLLFSTRKLGPNGFGAKVRLLDDRSTGPREIRALRAEVSSCINVALEKANKPQRVDHRTLLLQARDAARRGDLDEVAALSREPTRHLGRATTAYTHRGRSTHRAHEQEELLRSNAELLRQAQQRLSALRRELARHQPTTARKKKTLSRTARRPVGADRANAFLAGNHSWSNHSITDKATRMYVEELRRTAERIREATAQAVSSDLEIAALARWLAASKKNSAFLRRIHDAEAVLRVAEEEFIQARRAFGEASVQRGMAEDALMTLDRSKPPAYNFLSRRQWAQKRRAQKALADNETQAELALWKNVREGGTLPVAVAIAKQSLVREWNALRTAEEKTHTPTNFPASQDGAERVPTPARSGRSSKGRRP